MRPEPPCTTARRPGTMTSGGGDARPRSLIRCRRSRSRSWRRSACIYIVSQFLRNSVGVIAPNLATEIGLSPIEIGLLSSVYLLFVRGGADSARRRARPLRPEAAACWSASAITVLGCVLFALAHDAGGLIAARVLLGFGTVLLPDGAARALCALVSAGAVLDASPASSSASARSARCSRPRRSPLPPRAIGWRMTFLGVGVCAAAIGAAGLADRHATIRPA